MNTLILRLRRRAHGARLLWALFLVAGVASCIGSNPTPPCICTAEFRLFTIIVTDAAGQPAEGVSISVRRVSDGAVLFESASLENPGVYLILTDNNIGDVSEDGTAVEVTGTLGDTGFTAEYVFERDACRCHVSKVSGPDTAQLAPLPTG